MTKRMWLLSYITIIFIFPLPSAIAQAGQGCSGCSLVQRALKDAQGLKPGTTRKDIERHNFIEAGGMLFRDRTRYIYKDCEYITLEIEFDLDPDSQQQFSAKDVIKVTSKLAIDYPIKD